MVAHRFCIIDARLGLCRVPLRQGRYGRGVAGSPCVSPGTASRSTNRGTTGGCYKFIDSGSVYLVESSTFIDRDRARRRDPNHYLTRPNVFSDVGLSHRLLTAERALEDWRSRPIAGIALGGFLWKHRGSEDPPRGIQIHATPLWLLVETGIIGLVLFAAFFSL